MTTGKRGDRLAAEPFATRLLKLYTEQMAYLAGAAAMIGAQLLFTYAPVMNRLFHTAPITVSAWGLIVATGFCSFLLVELTKLRRTP